MRIRAWIKKENNTLEPISITATSRREAMKLLARTYPSREIHKIERWDKTHWKQYKRS